MSKRITDSKFLVLSFSFTLLAFSSTLAYALNLDTIKSDILKGDYKAAIVEGERVLAASGQAAGLDELYYLLGLSYLKDGNYLRASDIFEIILKEFKNSRFSDEARLGLGDTYFLRGNFSRAEEYYKELLAVNPNTEFKAQIYSRLSQTGFKRGDTRQGNDYLGKLRTLSLNLESKSPNNIDLPQGQGPVYYTVQVGFFSKPLNAENLKNKLVREGYPAYIEKFTSGTKTSYRLRVGKFNARQEALEMERKLSRQGYPTKVFP